MKRTKTNRIWFFITLGGVLTMIALFAGNFITRILGIIIIVYVLFFIVGRIGSRRSSENKKQERSAKKDDPIDASWHEVHAEEPRKEEFHKEEPRKEKAANDPAGSLQADIRGIERAADGIRHSQIREKAFHVLRVAKDIIREHTEENQKCRGYRQFENYYVPTLKSVITNYRMMEIKGMANAKMQEDFLAYLERCDDAFTNLYNSMFNDDIMEMEVQMEAMDIILKRDGLL